MESNSLRLGSMAYRRTPRRLPVSRGSWPLPSGWSRPTQKKKRQHDQTNRSSKAGKPVYLHRRRAAAPRTQTPPGQQAAALRTQCYVALRTRAHRDCDSVGYKYKKNPGTYLPPVRSRLNSSVTLLIKPHRTTQVQQSPAAHLHLAASLGAMQPPPTHGSNGGLSPGPPAFHIFVWTAASWKTSPDVPPSKIPKHAV